MNEYSFMSYNIRCLNNWDKDERHWDNRAPLVRDLILECAPDVLGIQEGTLQQVTYLTRELEGYRCVYKGRDTAENTETNAVFFRDDRFRLVKEGTFHLSDTYEEMSNTWGGACYRICTYVVLEDLKTGKVFVIFNTHLDHVKEEARVKGVKLIKRLIGEWGYEQVPHVIMGDMNDFMGSTTIDALLEGYVDSSFGSKEITYNEYGNVAHQGKIDYMVAKGFHVGSYEVVSRLYHGVYPSDHFPIRARFRII